MVLASLLVVSVRAQAPTFTSTHYDSDNIGLSHNTVLSIMQDSQGFLWIGTMDGLNRFDGKKVKVYRHDPGDSTTISDSFIHGVHELDDGRLWVGTRNGGISILDPKTDKIERISGESGIPDAPTNLFFKDTKGFYWVGFFESSIGHYNVETARYSPASLVEKFTGEVIRSVNAVIEFKDGAFLISSQYGIYYADEEEINSFRTNLDREDPIEVTKVLYSSESPSPNTIGAFVDSSKELWVEMLPEGFHKVDDRLMPEALKKSIDSGVARNASENRFIEREHYLIKGSANGNIEVINTETGERAEQSFTSEGAPLGTAKVFEDREGNIWFGSWGGGFYLLREQRGVQHVNQNSGAKGLNSNFMLSFEEESNGLWIGMAGGLSFWKDGSPKSEIQSVEPLTGINIWSMYRDEPGLWLATRINGLVLIPNEEIESKTYNARKFMPGNSFLLDRHVHQVLRDSRGWLWLGYEGQGVQVLTNVESWLEGSPANVLHLTNDEGEQSINSTTIRKIIEDENGNIWLGTNDNGANYVQIEGGTISGIKTFEAGSGSAQISHSNVRNIIHQNDSTFWFATYGGGIVRWNSDTDEVTKLTSKDGLANNNTYGILKDENPRFLWISTNNGLSRLDTQTLRFTNFTVTDGLQNNEFNTGAYYKRQNGDLIFGGVNGFNVIDTKTLAVNHLPPPVHITGINLFNKPYVQDTTAVFLKNLELPYNQNFVSFEFAALDFQHPTENEYAYLMEGVDADWVYSGNRNFADYPNLKPGNYTFRVKAANSDGFWNESGTAMSVKISPPWWQSTGFRVIAGSLILGLFIGLIRFASQRKLRIQIRKMEVENKLRTERERISRDLHDHVGAQLANIISGLSLVDKYNEVEEKEKSTKLMRSLKGDAEVTMKQLRDTIWALNQNELKLEQFIDHIRLYFNNQSALLEKLSLSFEAEGDKEFILSSAQALNLFRIIQEAAQNTLKYAEAKNFGVRIFRNNGTLSLVISDDGTFKSDSSDFNGGYGMKNMKKRAGEINASIEVNTNEGTEIKVTVKL